MPVQFNLPTEVFRRIREYKSKSIMYLAKTDQSKKDEANWKGAALTSDLANCVEIRHGDVENLASSQPGPLAFSKARTIHIEDLKVSTSKPHEFSYFLKNDTLSTLSIAPTNIANTSYILQKPLFFVQNTSKLSKETEASTEADTEGYSATNSSVPSNTAPKRTQVKENTPKGKTETHDSKEANNSFETDRKTEKNDSSDSEVSEKTRDTVPKELLDSFKATLFAPSLYDTSTSSVAYPTFAIMEPDSFLTKDPVRAEPLAPPPKGGSVVEESSIYGVIYTPIRVMHRTIGTAEPREEPRIVYGAFKGLTIPADDVADEKHEEMSDEEAENLMEFKPLEMLPLTKVEIIEEAHIASISHAPFIAHMPLLYVGAGNMAPAEKIVVTTDSSSITESRIEIHVLEDVLSSIVTTEEIAGSGAIEESAILEEEANRSLKDEDNSDEDEWLDNFKPLALHDVAIEISEDRMGNIAHAPISRHITGVDMPRVAASTEPSVIIGAYDSKPPLHILIGRTLADTSISIPETIFIPAARNNEREGVSHSKVAFSPEYSRLTKTITKSSVDMSILLEIYKLINDNADNLTKDFLEDAKALLQNTTLRKNKDEDVIAPTSPHIYVPFVLEAQVSEQVVANIIMGEGDNSSITEESIPSSEPFAYAREFTTKAKASELIDDNGIDNIVPFDSLFLQEAPVSHKAQDENTNCDSLLDVSSVAADDELTENQRESSLEVFLEVVSSLEDITEELMSNTNPISYTEVFKPEENTSSLKEGWISPSDSLPTKENLVFPEVEDLSASYNSLGASSVDIDQLREDQSGTKFEEFVVSHISIELTGKTTIKTEKATNPFAGATGSASQEPIIFDSGIVLSPTSQTLDSVGYHSKSTIYKAPTIYKNPIVRAEMVDVGCCGFGSPAPVVAVRDQPTDYVKKGHKVKLPAYSVLKRRSDNDNQDLQQEEMVVEVVCVGESPSESPEMIV